MPSYWTPKQERQYSHIKQSCIQRKCRTVRGKKQCVRTCTRMAAATTNEFRSRGLGGIGAVRKLSKRLLVTLQRSAANYRGGPAHGTNVLNNNMVAYELEKRGLVEIRNGFAFPTPAGYEALKTGLGGHAQTPHTNDGQYWREGPSAAMRARAHEAGEVGLERQAIIRALHTSPTRTADLVNPSHRDRTRAALRQLQERGWVERVGRNAWQLTDSYFAEHGTERAVKMSGARGLGNVRGKCCVVRGKKRIACFRSKKDALALKRSLKKTSGLKIRCV